MKLYIAHILKLKFFRLSNQISQERRLPNNLSDIQIYMPSS
jgi:hypothetical protein